MRTLTLKRGLFLIALSAATALPAHADSDVPAKTSSDYLTKPLAIDLQPDAIDAKNGRLELGVATGHDSTGSVIGSAELHAGKKYVAGTDDHRYDASSVSGTVLVNPGVNVRVDVRQDSAFSKPSSVSRVSAEVTGVGFIYAQALAMRPSEKSVAQAAAYTAAYRKLADEHENLAGDLRDQKEKELMQLKAKAESEGFYWGYDMNAVPRNDEATASIDFNLMGISGLYRQNDDMKIRQSGALFKMLNTSGHVAFKANGVPLDLCGAIVPVEVLAGSAQDAAYDQLPPSPDGKPLNPHVGTVMSACAGVKIPRLGQLENKVDYASNYGHYMEVSDTTSLKNVLGSPLSAYQSYEYERNAGVNTVTRTMFGVKAAF